ncbi:MAG: hypothetical protein FWE63_02010 [Bacteroidales bacterium]|nr:hypothetical protein [Bacteroidales bacterium]
MNLTKNISAYKIKISQWFDYFFPTVNNLRALSQSQLHGVKSGGNKQMLSQAQIPPIVRHGNMSVFQQTRLQAVRLSGHLQIRSQLKVLANKFFEKPMPSSGGEEGFGFTKACRSGWEFSHHRTINKMNPTKNISTYKIKISQWFDCFFPTMRNKSKTANLKIFNVFGLVKFTEMFVKLLFQKSVLALWFRGNLLMLLQLKALAVESRSVVFTGRRRGEPFSKDRKVLGFFDCSYT